MPLAMSRKRRYSKTFAKRRKTFRKRYKKVVRKRRKRSAKARRIKAALNPEVKHAPYDRDWET